MITLTTVMKMHEADLLCMKLAESGIQTFVPDQYTVVSCAIGGIRIQVDEGDLARAREVLGEQPQANRGMFTCPKCQSDSVDYERISKRLAFLSLLLIGFPLLCIKRTCVCQACGYKWKVK
jgi:DNA-directed RNA polymerase subunit M/transcription elongation factor TFIIS